MNTAEFNKFKDMVISMVNDAETPEAIASQFALANSVMGGTQKHTVTFGPDLLNGFGENGLDILPAVPDYVYNVEKVLAVYNHGGVSYSDTNNGNYFLTGASIQDYNTTILTSAQSRKVVNFPIDNQEVDLSAAVNEPIRLTADDTTPGFPNSGDGTLTITIWYTLDKVQ